MTLGYLVITVERLRDPVEKICQRFVELMNREKSLADLLEDFLANKNLKGRGPSLYRTTARKWFKDWLELPVRQVTPEMLAQRHQEIIEASSKQRATFAIWLFGKLCEFQGLPAPYAKSLPRRAINQRRIGDKKLPRWYQAVMSIQNGDVRDFWAIPAIIRISHCLQLPVESQIRPKRRLAASKWFSREQTKSDFPEHCEEHR